MRNVKLEISVGLFVLVGVLALAWLSVKMARMELVGGNHLPIYAYFSSISGLKAGASVEIAGVQVGRVAAITLDTENYEAKVLLNIDPTIPIQDDAIASIRTKGLIGDRYIKITPGASTTLVPKEGRLTMTEPAINFEELISQYIHGNVK